MKHCIVCGKRHDETFVDLRYCSKKCKLEDFAGDREQVERDNVTQSKIRGGAVLAVFVMVALIMVWTVVKIIWAKVVGYFH